MPAGLGHHDTGTQSGVAARPQGVVLSIRQDLRPDPRRTGLTGRHDMIRKATAVWRGTGRAGSGNLTTDSGVLAETPYSFKTRFESEKGTNPEELIAAAHAGCFTMALAFGLQAPATPPPSSVPRRRSLLTQRARASASVGRIALCAPRCQT